MTRRVNLFWLAPAVLALIVIGTLLALPGFVAAQNHRPAMERLASSLTGRQVHIGGALSLVLLPRPELAATKITIAGPDDELISAAVLKMDVSLGALLRGQLAARTLDLDSPQIAFPWPLPGGPRAIAPPPWLAALHAHLSNASISLGAMQFSRVNADLFTSPGGMVSISGKGQLAGFGVAITAALGPVSLDGSSPLTLAASAGLASGSFTGTLSGQSSASGQLTMALNNTGNGNVAASAAVIVDGAGIALSNIAVTQGQASLSGTATLSLTAPQLNADLLGQGLDFDALQREFGAWAGGLPVNLTLNASNVRLHGQSFPALAVSYAGAPAGVKISSLNLTLPGGGALTGAGGIDASGRLSGQASLSIPDTVALLAAYQLPPLPGWPGAHLSATLAGTAARPWLRDLNGTLGQDHVTGSLVLSAAAGGPQLAGALDFDHLALAPLAAWLGQRPGGGLTADLQITAARAEAGPVKLTDLALDAALDGTLNIRSAAAKLYGGLAAGSFTLDSAGRVSDAQGFADIPAATPLLAFFPAGWAPPADLLTGHLSLLFAARGPANALATSAVARLTTMLPDPANGKIVPAGDLTLTAAPIIDLTKGSASGALTAQYPEAILLARFFGVDHGLAWPGAGSASLRASFTASAANYGLDDFVLNFGATNASGRVMAQNGVVGGEITAGGLALPPVPAALEFPINLDLQGKVALQADEIIYAGKPLLGRSAGSLTWSTAGGTLDVAHTAYGAGTFSGSLGMALKPGAAPAFTAKILAQQIDAHSIALPLTFPYPISAGTLNATASLTASGYGLKSVVATLGGTATLAASNGVLKGFNLQGFGDAVGGPDAVNKLYHALITGSTDFTALDLAATLAQGNCTLTSATLTGPAGRVSGTGGIDLYDNAQALNLVFSPANITPPVSASLLVLGTWAAPKHIAHMKQALDWTAPPAAVPAAPQPAATH